ncbi:glutamine-hydrolyzing carbamoyl-phosphate synthase small subunit [Waterburya agarophytonicola K14]|uniref:Carbamoyl phosphate synthase small chain n=1 Tax=Waterburya agarophytonicola KI4 TaxID=2874699 RepID=A0A964BUN0_9CYAN|nr:glutamine-hydrolyzing carbamoyl-phosphate synthase small subunit [Waterburya agarophytonicola]MCC0179121.1 glutamine-hydrolyzing carbamoyl-phosphate synthase small subunit [Waterburya agarophytonicola KI4]
MLKPNAKPALLVLADGTTYHGWSFGAEGTAVGEVVFNTGMTGYQEVLTDPSYSGQIITFTYPELGNTGVNPTDEESDTIQAKAVIARNVTYRPSNWRSTQSLPEYLQERNIPGIYGLDTRSLTRKLRDYGAINGGISTEILDPERLLNLVKNAPDMAGLNLVKEVTTEKTYQWSEETKSEWEFAENISGGDDPLTVVAIDFGVKRNILRRLASYNCNVIVVPADTPSAEILAHNPDGIFLSNGPGDPAAVTQGIATTKELLEAGKPTFGICMGHQILGLSLGAETFKLKFGHRGLNQPAGMEQTQVEITSQNHGFAIAEDSLGADVEITHINLNDRTVAGVRHKTLPFFSVQYHPEASPGPHDADYLFAKFVKLMQEAKG